MLKRLLFAFGLLVLAAGCATSNHVQPATKSLTTSAVPADKALVVFYRPSSYGAAIQSTIYDGTDYIATLPADTRVEYLAEPGEHMFMVIAENADFLRATVDAGKTYHAALVTRPGLWKARFSFRPHNGQISEQDLQKWIDGTNLVEPSGEGDAWARENAASIKQKHDDYLAKWQSKPEHDKQTLHAESGM